MGNELKKADGLNTLATNLQVDPKELKTLLKSTIFGAVRVDKDNYREPTDAEITAIVAVSNAYNLNPIIKEIYAYPDTKRGRIVPVVSTDGWNRLMTTHREYKTHYYKWADDMETPNGGKPCPVWCEIHIVKKDGSEVIVREFLDECYVDTSYQSPWKTHTKRMLRHKTKIQGAREAFGFGGIYDKDEAERIVLSEDDISITDAEPAGKPDVSEPKAIENKEAKPEEKPTNQKSSGLTSKQKMVEKTALNVFNRKKEDYLVFLGNEYGATDVAELTDKQCTDAIKKLDEIYNENKKSEENKENGGW